MKAGTLDRRVTVQGVELYDDGYGEVETCADKFTTWAQSVQESGREFFQNKGKEATRLVIFRLRWRPGVGVTDRVIYRGVTHDIQDVKELGRAEGLELHTIASADAAIS